MQTTIIVLAASLALAFAQLPLPKPQTPQRETSSHVDNGVWTVNHREKIFENPIHKLDGSALYRQDLLNKDVPKQIGGRFDYQNKPSRYNVGVEAVNSGRFGTDVGLEASRNLFKHRDNTLDVGARVGQHFGGPGPRQDPSFGAFIRGRF